MTYRALIKFFLSFLWVGISYAKVDLSNLNQPFGPDRPFKGSVALRLSQVFFDDPRVGRVRSGEREKADHEWGALKADAEFGIYEWSWGIEPVVGVGFIRNSTLVREGSSFATYNYIQANVSGGFRYKFFGPDVFFMQPYIQPMIRYEFLRVRKSDPSAQPLQRGQSFGGEIATGLMFSFLSDADQKHQLRNEWDIADMGFLLAARWINTGWFLSPPYGIDTSAWDFGLGLYADW